MNFSEGEENKYEGRHKNMWKSVASVEGQIWLYSLARFSSNNPRRIKENIWTM